MSNSSTRSFSTNMIRRSAAAARASVAVLATGEEARTRAAPVAEAAAAGSAELLAEAAGWWSGLGSIT